MGWVVLRKGLCDVGGGGVTWGNGATWGSGVLGCYVGRGVWNGRGFRRGKFYLIWALMDNEFKRQTFGGYEERELEIVLQDNKY